MSRRTRRLQDAALAVSLILGGIGLGMILTPGRWGWSKAPAVEPVVAAAPAAGELTDDATLGPWRRIAGPKARIVEDRTDFGPLFLAEEIESGWQGLYTVPRETPERPKSLLRVPGWIDQVRIAEEDPQTMAIVTCLGPGPHTSDCRSERRLFCVGRDRTRAREIMGPWSRPDSNGSYAAPSGISAGLLAGGRGATIGGGPQRRTNDAQANSAPGDQLVRRVYGARGGQRFRRGTGCGGGSVRDRAGSNGLGRADGRRTATKVRETRKPSPGRGDPAGRKRRTAPGAGRSGGENDRTSIPAAGKPGSAGASGGEDDRAEATAGPTLGVKAEPQPICAEGAIGLRRIFAKKQESRG